ncbi:hypothetical protein [Roseomonas xinghualingensis]|uniref:hypothetical protein n=1 Tax=Roseomonas xinghualingensis TaxID=2986475 RepID=UPI0021F0D848|nr:hypothetical protein [Roseomonas sp. SXEYE001]MCV4210277.1 hypothetical protein [Roseomonas sp. SXEYE001]
MVEFFAAIGALHGFIQFCLVMLAGCVLRVILLVISRFYRVVMVTARGWPPDHLDADGDWKPEPEKEAQP